MISANLQEMSREEWLSMRRVGGSDAPTICGLNQWKTEYQLWLEKTNQIDDSPETESQRWGLVLEDPIAMEFAERTGLQVLLCEYHYVDDCFPFMTCTPDYFVIDQDGNKGLLSIKTTSSFQEKAWTDGVPDYAHVQLMHEFAVTGLTWGYIACLIGGQKLVWHYVECDYEVMAFLRKREREFWDCVENNTPPALVSEDVNTLDLLYPQAKNDDVLDLPELSEKAAQILACKAQIKAIQIESDLLEAQIKDVLQERTGARCGSYFVSWQNRIRESLDSKALKTQHPELASQFLKTTAFRQFSIKENRNGKE